MQDSLGKSAKSNGNHVQKSRLRKRLIMAFVVSGLAVALAYLAQSSQAALLSRSIRVKEDRLAQIQRENAQLRLEIAGLIVPARVALRAQALGLRPAQAVIYADLPDLRTTMADVLPAFDVDSMVAQPRSEWISQLGSWLETIRTLVGLPAGGGSQTAASQP